MIDVHCHLNFHSFQEDFDSVISRAFELGVTKIINTGTQISSSIEAVSLADKYTDLYAIVGVHPHHADKLIQVEKAQALKKEESESNKTYLKRAKNDHELPTDWITMLEKLSLHPKVLAIGEIGMDFYSYASNGIVDPKLQKKVFIEQILLAHRSKLPLQIHNRQAGPEILQILDEYKHLLLNKPGMFHCFAGSFEVLEKALSMGFLIGFDGNITYDGIAKGETVDLKEIAKRVPLDRIVIETDSPYLTPVPFRGQRNEPGNAVLVGKFLAEIKGVSYSSLVEQTTKNVYTMFTKLK